MFALLFDRRSLIVTGVALVGVGSLLFAAGVVTGLALRRERVVVPPYWLKYGPVETSDVRATDPVRGASPSRAATGGAGAGAGGGADPATPQQGVTPAPAAGDAAAGDPSPRQDWVPFAKPGDPTLSESSPPAGGVRAKPPEGATQDGVEKDSAEPNADTITPAPPEADRNGDGEGNGDDGGESSDGAAESGSATLGPAAGAEAPGATTRRAANVCPEPGQPTWFVQTGAYAVAGNAQVRRDSLQSSLAPGVPRPYLSRTTSRAGVELTLVRLGPFTTPQAARRAAAALDDAFVGRETEESAGGCGEDNGAVAEHGPDPGEGAAMVALATRVSPAD